MAVAKHSHAVSSLPQGTSSPKDNPHASARQDFISAVAGNEPSNQLEATDAFPDGSLAQHYKISRGGSGNTGQQSDEESFQCIRDAAAGKFRTLVQLNEEIQSSIEKLASLCLDAGPQQPSVAASFESCLARIGQHPSSCCEAITSTEHDCYTEGECGVHDLHPIQEGAGRLEDGSGKPACTCAHACNSNIMEGTRGKRMRRGLLGESGKAITAVYEAMREIQDVHSSDELMHFEFCGPFWELSEV
jgi:hypothetical protein